MNLKICQHSKRFSFYKRCVSTEYRKDNSIKTFRLIYVHWQNHNRNFKTESTSFNCNSQSHNHEKHSNLNNILEAIHSCLLKTLEQKAKVQEQITEVDMTLLRKLSDDDRQNWL